MLQKDNVKLLLFVHSLLEELLLHIVQLGVRLPLEEVCEVAMIDRYVSLLLKIRISLEGSDLR